MNDKLNEETKLTYEEINNVNFMGWMSICASNLEVFLFVWGVCEESVGV